MSRQQSDYPGLNMSPPKTTMLSMNAEQELVKLGVLMESVAANVALLSEGHAATIEKLDRVVSDTDSLKSSVADLQIGMRIVRSDVSELKKDVRVVRDELSSSDSPDAKKPRPRR